MDKKQKPSYRINEYFDKMNPIRDVLDDMEARIQKIESHFDNSNELFDKLISDVSLKKDIYTCTKVEREFLDELKEKYEIDKDGDLSLKSTAGRGCIFQLDFISSFKDLLK